jgi:FlaA1/EpsC-like NDP-sugar epimerase
LTDQAAPPADYLLGRTEFSGDLGKAVQWFGGKRVLVTGAAGSIGWHLVHALAAVESAQLVLIDQHEYSLFSLERALGGGRQGMTFELADVRDSARMHRVFERHAPQVVVHLAAAKHVPYGERFPEGAVETNVVTTERLLELAGTAGVERFVYPSSDKSVEPPSLYGATKRLAEALVQRHAPWTGGVVIRYVNIIGTRGSVVETFTQQVLDDRPLSVTDERMTRYWISMSEALWCVVAAAESGTAGDVLMPACGEPVPLLETARLLATWYRPDVQPYPIRCMGIRPGERLHEVLLSGNEWFDDGPAQGLRRVRTRRDPARLGTVKQTVDELSQLVAEGERERLRQRCLEAAEALQ